MTGQATHLRGREEARHEGAASLLVAAAEAAQVRHHLRQTAGAEVRTAQGQLALAEERTAQAAPGMPRAAQACTAQQQTPARRTDLLTALAACHSAQGTAARSVGCGSLPAAAATWLLAAASRLLAAAAAPATACVLPLCSEAAAALGLMHRVRQTWERET